MSKFWRIVSWGILAALLFDTVAAFAAKQFGFFYGYASIGSVFIYSLLGYVVYRQFGLVRAIGAGLLVDLVDSTLGLFISWRIGPGALPMDEMTPVTIAITVVSVLVFTVVCTLVGSGIARVIHGPRPQAIA